MGFDLFSKTGLLALGLVVAAIYILVEIKRMKHKLFALLLIALIVFMYFGAVVVFKNKAVDLGSANGIADATKTYFSWMVYAAKNVGHITANAVKMDWTSYDKNVSVNKTKK